MGHRMKLTCCLQQPDLILSNSPSKLSLCIPGQGLGVLVLSPNPEGRDWPEDENVFLFFSSFLTNHIALAQNVTAETSSREFEYQRSSQLPKEASYSWPQSGNISVTESLLCSKLWWCMPVRWETKAGGLQVQSQPGLCRKTLSQEKYLSALSYAYNISCYKSFIAFFIFFFLRQCPTLSPRLVWNSLCRPRWPWKNSHPASVSCAGVAGLTHHTWFVSHFLWLEVVGNYMGLQLPEQLSLCGCLNNKTTIINIFNIKNKLASHGGAHL